MTLSQDPSDEQIRRIARATLILLQADLRRGVSTRSPEEAHA
jgi:hypothetical protein